MRKLYLVTSAAALTAGLTATLALSATASTPPGWSALARDSFSRQVSGSWGAPDLGRGYVLTKSSAVKVGTTGTRAFSTMPSGQGLTAQLASVVAGDVHVENSTVLDAPAKTTYDVQYGWVARKQADGSGYSVRVRVNSAGKATLGLTRSNGAASTWLTGVTLPFTVAAGQQVQLEFQVVGTAPVADPGSCLDRRPDSPGLAAEAHRLRRIRTPRRRRAGPVRFRADLHRGRHGEPRRPAGRIR